MEDPFSIYARFYDVDYAGMDADQPMIQQFAVRCGSPILEVACGTGRVLLPLARKGYRVTGVDVSAAMLDRARAKIAAEGLGDRATLVEQDMRDLDLDGRFNLALVVSNSFLHMLTMDDQLAAVGRIRRHLEPGGLLLLDLFNPDLSRLLDFQGRVTLEKVMADPETGHTLMKFLTQTVDLGQQIIDVTFILDEVDSKGHVQRTLFPFSLRYLFRGELELLLRYAGFEVEVIYGSYDLDEFAADSERMIAVARRLD
jgi:ubiquinone/menaquinone biosynthesis C-methylase UbiE